MNESIKIIASRLAVLSMNSPMTPASKKIAKWLPSIGITDPLAIKSIFHAFTIENGEFTAFLDVNTSADAKAARIYAPIDQTLGMGGSVDDLRIGRGWRWRIKGMGMLYITFKAKGPASKDELINPNSKQTRTMIITMDKQLVAAIVNSL